MLCELKNSSTLNEHDRVEVWVVMYNNFNDSVLHIVISIIQRSALHDTKQFCLKIKQKT